MRFVGLLPAILPTMVAIFAAALLFGATPSQATPEQGVDVGATVSVEVASTSPSASPSASASPTASAGASTPSTSAPTSGTSGPATSEPTGGTTTGPGGEQSLGGVLYVSGLTWEYHPSINPLGGALDLHFTVRNVSTKPATGSARMWLNGIFGVQVGQLVDVPVTDLKPGETRVISGTVESLSQWTFVTASATFIPPAELDGATLSPLTRNTTVWYVPWFMLGVIAALSIALYEVRRRRFAREAAEAILDAATAAAGGTHP